MEYSVILGGLKNKSDNLHPSMINGQLQCGKNRGRTDLGEKGSITERRVAAFSIYNYLLPGKSPLGNQISIQYFFTLD